jgi:Rrf2 family protein
MFQLSKKVEYGLIAVRHMAAGIPGRVCTAKEIAEAYHIPFQLLAKVMQTMARHGYLASVQGVNGGYYLTKNPRELRVSAIINAIEGKANLAIIQCEAENQENCIIHTTCTIKNPLVKLQSTINRALDDLTIMEMV